MPPEATARPQLAEVSDTVAKPADDLDDAHHAIDYAGDWIRNADTKAGLLTASVAVVIAAGTAQVSASSEMLRPSDGREWLVLAILGFAVTALAVAIVALAVVITPRTPPAQAPSRFSFPTLASHAWRHTPATRAQAAEEAWEQANVLASIAQDKFRALRVASLATFTGLVLYACWAIAAVLLN